MEDGLQPTQLACR